ncbi:MAG: acetylglutamate kinase [Balneola sp.]|nr:MAG: acetylglutamate kinase [Balneola sp.]
MHSVKVIKIGGKIAEDDASLERFLYQISLMRGKKVLVHGGGVTATRIAEKLGIESEMIEGRRITSAKMLEVATMVYGGLINKKIVAKLQQKHVYAVGLTGADLNIVQSIKRSPEPIDFGWVGDISSVNHRVLTNMLELDWVPVLAPLTHDGNGNMLNTNADSIASYVARALSENFHVELILCFDKPGVMNGDKVVTEMNLYLYRHLKGLDIINNGMIPKLDLGFKALKAGVNRVTIKHADDIKDSTKGTRLVK